MGDRGDLRCSVVQVLDGRGECVGSGFLLDGGLLISCAHVVAGDGVPPAGPVMVRFPHLDGQDRPAEVVVEWWHSPDRGDVAFLRLVEPPPDDAQPVRLAERALEGRRVKAFGFPRNAPAGGHYGYGVVGDRVTSDAGQPWVQLTDCTEITEGFSGAPAVDVRTGLVVGMVDSIAPPDRWVRGTETAYVNPAEQLRALCPALSPAGVCPYRGLAHFTSEDTAWFFGREHAVDLVVGRFRSDGTPRLVALLGPSGSGKTSLVQAGVLPALAGGALPGSRRWAVMTARPGSDPFAELERAGLVGAGQGLAGATGRWLAEHPDRDRLVLVVDQFEELFGAAIPDSERRRLLDQLSGLADQQPQATVLLIMRNEFYSQLADSAPRLLEQQPVNVPPTLHRDELSAIIAEPAGAVGLAVEPGLVDGIVGDAGGGEPDAAPTTVLPLLEFALTELWEAREDGELTRERYRQIGGLTGALAGRCDHVFSELSGQRQTVARRLLTDLVEDPQEGHPELPLTRRRRRRSELPPALRDNPELGEVAGVLADQRLLVTGHDPDSGEPTYELIHDSLLRHWGRLREWLDTDREFRVWRARLEANHRAWAAGQGQLLSGSALEGAERQLDERRGDLPDHLVGYIEDSAREDRRRRDRDRRRVRALAGLLALVLILSGFTAYQARRQSLLAEAQRLAATANLVQDRQPEEALLLSLQALGTADTREAWGSLQSSLSKPWHARTALTGRTGAVRSLAFSPDGTLLATASFNDETVRLWDVVTHQQIGQPLIGDTEEVNSVVFSPDGKQLATASNDGMVRLWDVSTHQQIGQPLIGHTDQVLSVAFNPDGTQLATASDDATVRLWDAASWQQIGQLVGHIDFVDWVAFSPDGKLLATASDEGTVVRLWDVASREQIGQPLDHTDDIRSVAFSPDGKLLATGGRDQMVRMWDVLTRQQIGQPLIGHTDQLLSLAFSLDGKLLATGGEDDTVRLWDVTSHQQIGQPLIGHTGTVESVAFSPDGKLLATASDDATVRLWNMTSRQPLGQPLDHTDDVRSVAFSPDGKLLATGDRDQMVRMWDVLTRQQIGQPLIGHTGTVESVAFSLDGKLLATGEDDTVRLWDVTSHQQIGQPLIGHTDHLLSLAFSLDGKLLATGGEDDTVRLWDVTSHQQIGQPLIDHTGTVESVAFSPDGKLLATASRDQTVRLWNMTSRQPLGQPLDHTDDVRSVAFSPDGKQLATASGDRSVRLWDVASRQPLGQPLTGHTGSVASVVFSPDGELLATASGDGTVRLWEVGSRRPLGEPLTGHTGAVVAVAFSPDGKLLATGSADQAARLWAIPATWVDQACELVGRNLSQDEWDELIGADRPYVRHCAQFPSGPGAPSDAPVARYPAPLEWGSRADTA